MTGQQEQQALDTVRSRIRLCKDYVALERAALRFMASMYGRQSGYYDVREQEYITAPEKLLWVHSCVMNAKSARCQTLRRLADAVIAQAELPMYPADMIRGDNYRVDLGAAFRKWNS